MYPITFKKINEMSFSDNVKLKAQSALKPYLAGDYPLHVKNPILLLNYLHQHAIIPAPSYFVMGVQNQLQHAVSCKIGDLEMIGNGNTNKIAKTNAAQQFLDLLLKPVKISSVHSSLNSVTSLANSTSDVYSSVPFSYVRNVSKSRVSSLNTEYRVENCILNGVNKSTSTTCLVEPQSSRDEIVQIHFKPNVFSENITMDTSETSNEVSVSKFQITPSLMKQKSENTFQVSSSPTAHQQSNCDDFFDPFFMTDVSKTRSKVRLNTFEIAISLPTQSEKTCEAEFQVNPSAAAHERPSCDDFFDPFFKQRPPNLNNNSIMETRNTENHIQNPINQSNHTAVLPSVVESKNVFALLQKKTQKHLKLIPRFRIESTESGFQCNVRIGSYYASGEGKNKKEAKTKAAVSLLNQMNDLN